MPGEFGDTEDVVVQRLFAVAMTLHHAKEDAPTVPAARKIGAAIDEIDSLIKEVRSVVWETNVPRGGEQAPRGAAD